MRRLLDIRFPRSEILADAAGVAALFVLLIVALHLPFPA